MIVYQNSLYTFELIEDRQVLSFTWTMKTAEMTYENFQDACSNYAGFAIEHNIQRLFVDTMDFRFQMPEEFISWREQKLNPRYYRIDVKKFAYLMPKDIADGLEELVPEDDTFTTSYFGSKQEALNWLTKD